MTIQRIRGAATLVGVAALVLAGPTAAAVADSDLPTFGEDQTREQPPEGDQEWSLDRSRESEDPQTEQPSRLESLAERDDSSREVAADDTTAGDTAASGPAEDFCDEAFGDDDDAHAQCMQFAESLPSEEEGGEEEDPFQQFCDEAFADDEDAHAQCTELAQALGGEDEGGDGEDEPTDDETEDGTGEDDATDGDAEDNPFQQFCDEAFADNEDAHAQCTEFAGNFADDGGEGGEGNPFQQFCDEAFADNEDAHAQCTEFAQALAGDDEGGGDGGDDSGGGDDTTDDGTDGDETGVLAGEATSPGSDSGALPVTGLNLAVASLSSLSLLGLGGALLRRFRADSLA